MRGIPAPRASSMLATMGNGFRQNEIALQYIQTDLGKMKSIVNNIEETSNKAIPLVPQNLSSEISNLQRRTKHISKMQSSFNYDKIKTKFGLTKDSMKDLSKKIMNHVNADPGFTPTNSYADSFLNDVKNRILDLTKQQCSNLHFCVDSELKSLSHQTQQTPLFLTEAPHFETPSPKVVFCRRKTPASESEKVILAIKDQTDRLCNIYSRISELRELRKKKMDTMDLPSLTNLQDEDSRVLSELSIRYSVLQTQSNFTKNKNSKSSHINKNSQNENEKQNDDVIMKEQLDVFEKLTDSMIQNAQEKLENAKKNVKEEIQMIRARLELLENRINEYGDFNGETDDMMAYIGMKVDDVLNAEKQIGNAKNDDHKNEEMAKVYIDVRTRITKNAIDNDIEQLKKTIRRMNFKKPLV
ncbi:hypothetical protein TRFO_23417 [Tritrichomonas foetus]|uniref:Uncharacterized protein n=1 Tax=Tritrichomonas foetus TaxID=1144522 RepID=A0A1J4KEX5_9EUKA|nr:hypothetical protein TRFO_23417 [Tritrichomonas foetus]|eukprot:OHT08142.1 hypothetical protein TRFO_23417 [Tritrichomonas foetus]